MGAIKNSPWISYGAILNTRIAGILDSSFDSDLNGDNFLQQNAVHSATPLSHETNEDPSVAIAANDEQHNADEVILTDTTSLFTSANIATDTLLQNAPVVVMTESNTPKVLEIDRITEPLRAVTQSQEETDINSIIENIFEYYKEHAISTI